MKEASFIICARPVVNDLEIWGKKAQKFFLVIHVMSIWNPFDGMEWEL